MAGHITELSRYIHDEAIRHKLDYIEMGSAFQEGVLRAVDALVA